MTNPPRFVEIAPPRFQVALDIRYATADNLTGRPIYARPLCLLHPAAAERLAVAVDLAAAIGLRLCIFDGYRPPAAQSALWNAVQDSRFVAEPRRGSNHTRGVAVDLTLTDVHGVHLDMGTGFDDTTPRSFHGDTAIPVRAQRNRLTLLGIMATAGFRHYAFEWWHYQLPDAASFPLVEDGTLGPPLM